MVTLLGYGESQILEVFKNTLPIKLYWVLFPIEDIRQVVETAKRILTREKIDRQLAEQSPSTPFMSMKDSYTNKKKATFDTHNGIEEKLYRLTMMVSRLTTKELVIGSSQKYIKGKEEVIQTFGGGCVTRLML